ncbi:hypothetical protein Hjap01_01451 [Haloarcula japonica]
MSRVNHADLFEGASYLEVYTAYKYRLMASRACDGCDTNVSIAGGIANIWSQESRPTEGIVLELGDDTEHFLCYDCIDRLPDDQEVTAADVAAL